MKAVVVSYRSVLILLFVSMMWGCALKPSARVAVEPPVVDTGLSERVTSEEELLRWEELDPELTLRACWEILARLNIKDKAYVREDVKAGRKMKVPNDFRAYKDWSPLPEHVAEMKEARKLILVVKDIPFLGWYEKGLLIGDAQVCIGKKSQWTKSGAFKVIDKDEDHISSSYRNAFGLPAPMPYALRIYGTVWIHAGDVVSGNCSHGCINLPLSPAQELFSWADRGTTVLVLESLNELEAALRRSAALRKKT